MCSDGASTPRFSGDDRPSRGRRGVGAKLLNCSGLVFRWWRRFGSGTIRRTTLQGYVGWLRRVVRLNLEAGRDGPCQATAKVCRQLLAIEGSLWTFARVEGVSPENNAAERALRHGVICRRTSGGTDGERGGRFVGRVSTVVATCRQRGRHVLDFLSDCFRARFLGQPRRSSTENEPVGSPSPSTPVNGYATSNGQGKVQSQGS